MMYWKELPPPKNYFNTFNKGRGYFLTRLVLEALFLLILLVGCFQLMRISMGIYPTVVRTPDYRVSLGTAKPYTPLLNEVVIFAQDVLEALYTRTEKGSPVGLIEDYVAPNIARAAANMQRGVSASGFVQTAALSGFFISSQTAEGVTGYAELTVVQNTRNKILMDTLYFNVAIRRVGITSENPTGWQLIGIKDIARDIYLREQRAALQEDSEPAVPQSMLDFDIES